MTGQHRAPSAGGHRIGYAVAMLGIVGLSTVLAPSPTGRDGQANDIAGAAQLPTTKALALPALPTGIQGTPSRPGQLTSTPSAVPSASAPSGNASDAGSPTRTVSAPGARPQSGGSAGTPAANPVSAATTPGTIPVVTTPTPPVQTTPAPTPAAPLPTVPNLLPSLPPLNLPLCVDAPLPLLGCSSTSSGTPLLGLPIKIG